METKLQGTNTEVIIGPCRPTVIIGDRINAVTDGRLMEALRNENIAVIQQEAISQVQEGAEIININIRGQGLDEKKLLPLAVAAVANVVTVPLCIDTEDPDALAAALDVCPGRPLVNSISCRASSLQALLPIAARRGAAVIGVARDDNGVPRTAAARIEMAREILRQCITAGIAREDIILNPLVLPLKDDSSAALATLEAIRELVRFEAVNVTIRPGLIAGSLPYQEAIIDTFSAMAIHHGATSSIIDPVQGKRAALIANLLSGQNGAIEHHLNGGS